MRRAGPSPNERERVSQDIEVSAGRASITAGGTETLSVSREAGHAGLRAVNLALCAIPALIRPVQRCNDYNESRNQLANVKC